MLPVQITIDYETNTAKNEVTNLIGLGCLISTIIPEQHRVKGADPPHTQAVKSHITSDFPKT